MGTSLKGEVRDMVDVRRAETYPCASSRGNVSRGKDRRIIGLRPCDITALPTIWCSILRYNMTSCFLVAFIRWL